MEPKDALGLFLSIQALLLAASSVGVAVWRSRTFAEEVQFAKDLPKWCTRLIIVLAVGGIAAWLDIFARCSTAPDDALGWVQAGAIAVALLALPWIARQIEKGAA